MNIYLNKFQSNLEIYYIAKIFKGNYKGIIISIITTNVLYFTVQQIPKIKLYSNQNDYKVSFTSGKVKNQLNRVFLIK